MKYNYLTFDCYGTLIDWRAGIEKELRTTLGDIGVSGQELMKAYLLAEIKEESTYKKYREVLRRTVMSLSGLLGTKVDKQMAEDFAASVPRWPVFPDTARFLHEMGIRGYERHILSNVDNDLLEETIKNSQLEVDGFVTAEEVGSYKPNPEHWLRFMQKTGAKKEEMLHVAQSFHHDIIPARAMLIDSAWVNRYEEPMPQGPDPLIVSDTLTHLAELLERPSP